MSQTQYSTESYVVDPGDAEPPECPPESEFTLMLLGIKEIGLSRPFEGKEPQTQFTLEFKIDAERPAPGSLQAEWHHFDLIGWFTPILHYGPDLPDFNGQRYTEPNLYKLVRALNDGRALPLPIARDPVSDRSYFLPYDAAELLKPFFGKRFRSVVGPSRTGWARLKGDPMPLIATGTRRRGAKVEVVEAEPVEDSDNPFVQDDNL